MRTIDAVFQDGVFRPAEPVLLEQGTSVRVLVPDAAEALAARLSRRFPNSFGVLSDEDANEIAGIINEARMLHTPVPPDLPESEPESR